MPRIIESMTRCTFQWGFRTFVIRVWRNEEKLQAVYDNADILLVVVGQSRGMSAPETVTGFPPIIELVGKIEKLPRINAVEIIDEQGSGSIVYPEWP